jgi:hypothetical protein
MKVGFNIGEDTATKVAHLGLQSNPTPNSMVRSSFSFSSHLVEISCCANSNTENPSSIHSRWPKLQNPQWFDLDMLDQHNFPIEHDGSLSRGDVHFGDDHTFSPAIFASYLHRFEGHETVSIELASKAY